MAKFMRWPGSLVANKAAVSVMEQRWGGRQSESPLLGAMTDKLPPPSCRMELNLEEEKKYVTVC